MFNNTYSLVTFLHLNVNGIYSVVDRSWVHDLDDDQEKISVEWREGREPFQFYEAELISEGKLTLFFDDYHFWKRVIL